MKGINIKDRNYELYSVVKNNEVFTMELTKKDLIAALSEKQTIINKAIDYVNKQQIICEKVSNFIERKYAKTMLNHMELILKGEDKE